MYCLAFLFLLFLSNASFEPSLAFAQEKVRFPIGESVEVRQRFNVAPGDEVLAVFADVPSTELAGDQFGDGTRSHGTECSGY